MTCEWGVKKLIKAIKLKNKELSLLKPYTSAKYDGKTVLTDSCWEYVELWLKRQKGNSSKEALFYWQQAKSFYLASSCLPDNAKPLTSYYCCLNAAKSLLCVRNISVKSIRHGIRSERESKSNSLSNIFVEFQNNGVLYELSKVLCDEAVNKNKYSIKNLLYNIPCIHRTFCITYSNSQELFIPIYNLKFMYDTTLKKAWFQFDLDSKYSNKSVLRKLPLGFKKTKFQYSENQYTIRKENNFIKWDLHVDKKERLNNLSLYHGKIRKNIFYIYGNKKLWYIKKNIESKDVINRSSMVLIFAVMHWLSELVRYNPEQFDKYTKTKQNWLLHEFIQKSLNQFIDEISCEITGEEILSTGYRNN